MSNRARVNVSFSEHLKEEISEELTEEIGLELEQRGCHYDGEGWYGWEEIKWTSNDEDLIELSKLYPEVVFEVRVFWLDGELCPEYSVYYLNGKHSEELDELMLDPKKLFFKLSQQDILDVANYPCKITLTDDEVREVGQYYNKMDNQWETNVKLAIDEVVSRRTNAEN